MTLKEITVPGMGDLTVTTVSPFDGAAAWAEGAGGWAEGAAGIEADETAAGAWLTATPEPWLGLLRSSTVTSYVLPFTVIL
jgi:hypothetical protein